MGLNLQGMTTETRNPRTMGLDGMSELEIVTVMNEEDARRPAGHRKNAAPDRPGSPLGGGSL